MCMDEMLSLRRFKDIIMRHQFRIEAMQQHSFDSMCTHPDCLSQQNAFFNYEGNIAHRDHDDLVMMIHPKQVKQLVKQDEHAEISQRINIKSWIEKVVDEETYKLSNFIRQHIVSVRVQQVVQALSQKTKIDSDSLLRRLKLGDHKLFQRVMKYSTSKRDVPFQEYYYTPEQKIIDLKNQMDRMTRMMKSEFLNTLETLKKGDPGAIKIFSRLEQVKKAPSSNAIQSRKHVQQPRRLRLIMPSNIDEMIAEEMAIAQAIKQSLHTKPTQVQSNQHHQLQASNPTCVPKPHNSMPNPERMVAEQGPSSKPRQALASLPSSSSNSAQESNISRPTNGFKQLVHQKIPRMSAPVTIRAPKSKAIHKAKKPQRQESSNDEDVQLESYKEQESKRREESPQAKNNQSDIYLKNQKQLIIQRGRYPLNALSRWVNRTSQVIQAIHIFDSKFATNEVLNRLPQMFPHLTRITLNCNNALSQLHLNSFSAAMTKIEIRWAFDLFFTQYHLAKYFPINLWKNRERNFTLPASVWQKLSKFPRNDTLWIPDIMLQLSRQNGEQSIDNIQLLRNLRNLTNLRTMSLIKLPFKDNTMMQVCNLIERNKLIKTIVVDRCCGFFELSDMFLDTLTKLLDLSKLSISSSGETSRISFSKIMRLRHLTSLQLHHLCFREFDSVYTPPSQHSNIYKELSNLRLIQQLSLHSCQPVSSDLLNHLHPECLPNITFLAIGETRLDNKCLQTVAQMKSLKHLSFEQTNITPTGFLHCCDSYLKRFGVKMPLKSLSVSNMSEEYEFKARQFEGLAMQLPQLEYIYLIPPQNFELFDFGRFKALKTVAYDKKLKDFMPFIPTHIHVHEYSDE